MNAAARKAPPLMTVAEFLDWPNAEPGTRYELVDGDVRSMAPASDKHATIVGNLNYLLAAHLRLVRPGCRVVANPGVQPRLRSEWNFRVPDLGVTCSPNRADTGVMTPDPVLLVEVLSPGNKQGETWSNIPLYATLPSVTEILIVHSSVVRVEVLQRDAAGVWPEDPEMINGLDGIVELASIALPLPLLEVYRNTHIGPQT